MLMRFAYVVVVFNYSVFLEGGLVLCSSDECFL